MATILAKLPAMRTAPQSPASAKREQGTGPHRQQRPGRGGITVDMRQPREIDRDHNRGNTPRLGGARPPRRSREPYLLVAREASRQVAVIAIALRKAPC